MTSTPHHGRRTRQLPGTLVWQDAGSADPDLSFRFFAPHGARITMTAPLVGVLLRCAHKSPALHCQRMPGGWSLTVVVGLSQVFLSTRALRLPESSQWHATAGRVLDRPLRRLVRARLRLEEGGRDSTAAAAQQHPPVAGSIVVKPQPAEQNFRPDFPIRVVLPHVRGAPGVALP